MELANGQYIRLDKFSIFFGIVKATDEENNNKAMFFQKLLETVIKYEKETKQHISTLYISIENLCDPDILEISELPIKRQTLFNAALYAMYNGDMDMVQKLTSFFLKNEIFTNELGELLNYVLEHSMDMNEYIEGEKERIIYNEKEGKLEEGHIFSMRKQTMKKKLDLK